MVSKQTKPSFNNVIEEIISTTSIVSLLAASAIEWPNPKEKTTIAECLVTNHIRLTLAGHWVDKTPDAQRMLHDVVLDWGIGRANEIAFSDVRESIKHYCAKQAIALEELNRNEVIVQAFRDMAEAF